MKHRRLDIEIGDPPADRLGQHLRGLGVGERLRAGELEGAAGVAVVDEQAGRDLADVAGVDEADRRRTGRQRQAAGGHDRVAPERVKVLHEPVGPQDVERHAGALERELDAAQRPVGGVDAERGHQHELLQPALRGLRDERREQALLVGVPGRRQQEQAVDAGERGVAALAGDEVEVDPRDAVDAAPGLGVVAGRRLDGVAVGEQRGEGSEERGADGARGADDGVTCHVRDSLLEVAPSGLFGAAAMHRASQLPRRYGRRQKRDALLRPRNNPRTEAARWISTMWRCSCG
jgi:hypothetical protein